MRQPEGEENGVETPRRGPGQDIGGHEGHCLAGHAPPGQGDHLRGGVQRGDTAGAGSQVPGPDPGSAGDLQHVATGMEVADEPGDPTVGAFQVPVGGDVIVGRPGIGELLLQGGLRPGRKRRIVRLLKAVSIIWARWRTGTIERLRRSEHPRARYEPAEDGMNLRRQLNAGIAGLPGDDFLADAVAC